MVYTRERIAGLWHDLGKYSAEFQDYLRTVTGEDIHQAEVRGRVDHSTAGAQHAASKFAGVLGLPLSYVIAGHHAGLPDFCKGRKVAKSNL